MKRVGIREFRDHATRYLANDEVLVIERNGQPIGVYIPTGADTDALRPERFARALAELDQTVRQVLARTGLSEDALSRLYDLSQPVADPHNTPHLGVVGEPDAPGR
jgi:hypothetical protein